MCCFPEGLGFPQPRDQWALLASPSAGQSFRRVAPREEEPFSQLEPCWEQQSAGKGGDNRQESFISKNLGSLWLHHCLKCFCFPSNCCYKSSLLSSVVPLCCCGLRRACRCVPEAAQVRLWAAGSWGITEGAQPCAGRQLWWTSTVFSFSFSSDTSLHCAFKGSLMDNCEEQSC